MNLNAGFLDIFLLNVLRLLVVLKAVGVLRSVIGLVVVPAKSEGGVSARHCVNLHRSVLGVDLFRRVVATRQLIDFD